MRLATCVATHLSFYYDRRCGRVRAQHARVERYQYPTLCIRDCRPTDTGRATPYHWPVHLHYERPVSGRPAVCTVQPLRGRPALPAAGGLCLRLAH